MSAAQSRGHGSSLVERTARSRHGSCHKHRDHGNQDSNRMPRCDVIGAGAILLRLVRL